MGVSEGGGRVSALKVPPEGKVSLSGPGYEARRVAVTVMVGGSSSRVGVADGKKEAASVSRGLMSNGAAVGMTVGGSKALLRLPAEKIHAIPRIETTPIAIGIKRVRSNGERGCISDRFYPHSFNSF